MKCERCGARTEVTHTTQRGQATHRRRECGTCGHRFTTHEAPARASVAVDEDQVPQWLHKLSRRSKIDRDALMDAVRVDRRKHDIHRQLRQRDMSEVESLRELGLDDQADEIERETLRRELEGY